MIVVEVRENVKNGLMKQILNADDLILMDDRYAIKELRETTRQMKKALGSTGIGLIIFRAEIVLYFWVWP